MDFKYRKMVINAAVMAFIFEYDALCRKYALTIVPVDDTVPLVVRSALDDTIEAKVADLRKANAEHEPRAIVSCPECGCSDVRPDFAWYCPTCERDVQNEHVTFQETHDPRCGGCGYPVEPNDGGEFRRDSDVVTSPLLGGNGGAHG